MKCPICNKRMREITEIENRYICDNHKPRHVFLLKIHISKRNNRRCELHCEVPKNHDGGPYIVSCPNEI
jgi:hypothetical protein